MNDFLIVHSPADLDRADTLSKQLTEYGYVGRVVDKYSIEQHLDNVRYVLLCISKHFNDDSFIELIKIVTRKWLNYRIFRIYPVYLDKQIHVEKKAEGHFRGLMQFTCFYHYNKFFKTDVKTEFEKYKR